MSEFTNHAINFFIKFTKIFKRIKISDVSSKNLLTEEEFALYIGRSPGWVYDRLRKKGVLMEHKHYFDVCGVILYLREQIEQDIISCSLNLKK